MIQQQQQQQQQQQKELEVCMVALIRCMSLTLKALERTSKQA